MYSRWDNIECEHRSVILKFLTKLCKNPQHYFLEVMDEPNLVGFRVSITLVWADRGLSQAIAIEYQKPGSKHKKRAWMNPQNIFYTGTEMYVSPDFRYKIVHDPAGMATTQLPSMVDMFGRELQVGQTVLLRREVISMGEVTDITPTHIELNLMWGQGTKPAKCKINRAVSNRNVMIVDDQTSILMEAERCDQQPETI